MRAHINRITSKANSTLGFLRRNLKACPPKLRETAYFSLVRSSLEYSSAVWDPFRQKDIDKLEKIQRSAARFVTQNYRQTASVTSLLQNLGWTDLKTRGKNSRHRTIPDWNSLLAAAIISKTGSVQESAGWLSLPALFPLQPDTPHRRCCWSTKSKSKWKCDQTLTKYFFWEMCTCTFVQTWHWQETWNSNNELRSTDRS